MPRPSNSSQSSKMRKKRAAARAAAAASAPPPPVDPAPATPAPYNPAPAAMPAHIDPPRSALTDWDAAALALLRKLSKRDATTRLRALSDLRAHLVKPPQSTGDAFLSRLATTFPALLRDGHPRARAAALHVAADAARVFRRRAQPALRAMAAHWVAARADHAHAVASAARVSLEAAFPERRQRAALAAFAAPMLRDYCYEELALLDGDEDGRAYMDRAAHICAVVEWVAEEGALNDASNALAEFVDDIAQPLLRVAAMNGGAHQAPAPVCRAALPLLATAYIDVDEKEHHTKRAHLFATVALQALQVTPAAWDVLLVLFARGWAEPALGAGLTGVEDALAEALQAPTPPPVAALLPLLAALPSGASAASIAHRVLCTLRAMLGVPVTSTDVVPSRQQVPSSYALIVLPAYLESAHYALIKGDKWATSDGADAARMHLLREHIAPVARALLVGDVLPCAPLPRAQAQPTPGARRAAAGRDDAVVHALVGALAAVNGNDAQAALADTPAAFAAALAGGKQDGARLAERYCAVLRGMPRSAWARALGSSVIDLIVAPAGAHPPTDVVQHEQIFMRILADSVAIIPALADDVPSERRQQCADYAIPRASADPAAAGVLLAWATAAPVSSDIVVDANEVACRLARDYADTKLVSFSALAAMVNAHAAKRPKNTNASCWKPYSGTSFETFATEAATRLQAGENDAEAALKVLAALVRLDGGVLLEEVTHKQALAALANVVRKDSSVTESVVEAALSGTWVDTLPPHVLEFAGVAVPHRGLTASVSAFLANLPESCWLACGTAVLDEIGQLATHAQSEDEEQYVRLAVLWRDVVDKIVGEETNKATKLHAILLDRFHSELFQIPLSFLESFVDNVPLQKLFGGTDGSPLLTVHLLNVYQIFKALPEEPALTICAQLEAHVRTLPTPLRTDVAKEAVSRILFKKDQALLPVVTAALLPDNSSESELDVETVIAALVAKAVDEQKSAGLVPNACKLVVQVLEMTATASKRHALPCFRETLQQASASIRRDPNSRVAQFSAMLLGAALVPENGDFMAEHPDWLIELVAASLKAIRRAQESRSIGQAPTKKKRLSESTAIGTGAVLMSRAVDALEVSAINSDDWRFWSMTVEDTLLDAHSADARRRASQCIIANISALAVRLIKAHESSVTRLALRLGGDVALPIRVKCEEICHRGAWSAIIFLPTLATGAGSANTDRPLVLPADPVALAQLAVMAVKRKVLIPVDRSPPIAGDMVYALTPLLSSSYPDVRRAALILLIHAARVELPLTVAREFPSGGFTDEAHEERFVRNMVPPPFKTGLAWTGDADADIRKSPVGADHDPMVQNLGYFLLWRVFLELISAHDKAHVNEEGEDVSFRRIGVTFLCNNEALFETFFARCVSVVVYGSTAEKEIATSAIVQVLSNSGVESKLQGIQIARAQGATSRTGAPQEDGDNSDEKSAAAVEDGLHRQVCAAAGAAFARALQRLPALSRRLGTDRLGLSDALAVEQFAEEHMSRLLIALEVDRARAWGAFGGTGGSDSEGTVSIRGSVAGREVGATYAFSDVTLEIVLRLPADFPLHAVEVDAKSAKGMSEARWQRTKIGIASVLQQRDGSVVEAVELWRRNLDKTFEGVEECPICYSVLHLTTSVLPRKKCGTCKHLFHSDCITKWFKKSDNSACPLCRSPFY